MKDVHPGQSQSGWKEMEGVPDLCRWTRYCQDNQYMFIYLQISLNPFYTMGDILWDAKFRVKMIKKVESYDFTILRDGRSDKQRIKM
jgi:hypothetical protein